MQIKNILKRGFSLSFEVFPPVREGNLESLFTTIAELQIVSPDFISVTYGSGGGSKDKTVAIAARIKSEFPCEALAHLTCVGASALEIKAILTQLSGEGVENILALRGDPPKDEKFFRPSPGGFSFASELIHFIRENWEGGEICIGTAGYPEKHPEAPSLAVDIENLRNKVAAGADFITTQLFFDNDVYFRFVEASRRKGITVPIIPGIFPVLNYAQITKIVSLCHAKIPLELGEKLNRFRDYPAETEKYGIEFAIKQTEGLITAGVPGLHFYTMNKSSAVLPIIEALDFPNRSYEAIRTAKDKR